MNIGPFETKFVTTERTSPLISFSLIYVYINADAFPIIFLWNFSKYYHIQ